MGVEVAYYQCGDQHVNVEGQECLEACVIMGVMIEVDDSPEFLVKDYI